MLKTSHMRTLRCVLSSVTRMEHKHIWHLPQELKRIKTEMTIDDWKALRSSFDAPIIAFASVCIKELKHNLQPSRSLLIYLESENALSLYMKCLFLLTLCHNHNHCTPEDHKFIESTVHDVFEEFADLQVSALSSHILAGISVLPSWKEWGLKVIDHLKSGEGRPQWCNAHLEFAKIAFHHNDIDLAFKLVDEVISKSSRTFDHLKVMHLALDKIHLLHDYKSQKKIVMRLLQFMCDTDLKPDRLVIWQIAKWFQDHSEAWLAHFTQINKRGKCSFCGYRLRFQPLTEDELSSLRTELLENLVRQDLRGINPVELCAFEDFLERAGPYTVVVDGNTTCAHTFAHFNVKYLLRSLEENGEKVLVLGHSNLVDGFEGCDILTHKNFFATNYPQKFYLLFVYAAMRNQGQGAYFLSNYSFRRFNIFPGNMDLLFKKWKEQKQVFLNILTHCVIFPAYPNKYQISEDGLRIHVPESDFKTWLCLKNVGKTMKDRVVKKYPLVMPDAEPCQIIERKVGGKGNKNYDQSQYFLINHPGQRQ